jgi:hypothetical protein
MNEPLRWLDDRNTSSSLREVLKAAPAAPPLPAQRHAQISSYATGLAAKGLLTKVTALAWLSGGSAVKAIAWASLMGALGTGSYWVVRQQRQSMAPSAAVQSNLVATLRKAQPETSFPLGSPTASPVRVEAESNPPLTAAAAVEHTAEPSGRSAPNIAPENAGIERAPSPTPSRAVASFDDIGIADEARLLEQARGALANNPARALEIANRHQELHPTGQLSAEREFIVVDALLRLGRRDEAERRAAPSLARNPESLYARRLRQLLGPMGR